MRVMVYKRTDDGTDVVLIPGARERGRPQVLRGLGDGDFKESVREAIRDFDRENPAQGALLSA